MTNADRHSILVVGDAAGVLTYDGLAAGSRLQFCDSIVRAVALAAEQHFSTIYVVMSGLDPCPRRALRTLRRTSPYSRILLLAEMHEEAAASQLIRTIREVANPADGYRICPVDLVTVANAADPIIAADSCAAMIDTRAERIRQLERLAMEDDLTGLKNRRYVREFLLQITAKACREDFRVTLLVFDIDNFKQYNDSYGHTTGDHVLRQTAVMMRRCCRPHDITGRIGGDEFAFVFWDCPDTENPGTTVEPDRRHTVGEHPREAVFMAERFRKEISSAELSFLGTEGTGVLTVSGGLASFPKDGRTVDRLFEQADKALLEAKRSGKNQIYLVGTTHHSGKT